MHLFAIPLLLAATAQALLVPAPPGPYSVAVKPVELIDPHRNDPLAPQPDTKRRYMASVYMPIDARYECAMEVVPYMPALTASVFGKLGATLGVPQGTLEKFEIAFCDLATVKGDVHVPKQEFPVAVFSPGLGGTRLIYGALARSLASLGYIIITLDHTYETEVVQFLDGSVVYGEDFNFSPNNVTTILLELLKVRTGDVSFVASQLSNATFTASVFAGFPGTFDPQRVAVYGHSLGGATAADAAQSDARVIGGLNFDGTIDGPVAQQAFSGKPFLLVESAAHLNSTPSVLEWDTFYQKLDAAKMRLAVRHTQHYAFTDVPLLLMVDPVPAASQPTVDAIFGTLNGTQVERAVDEVMAGLLELLFHNRVELLEDLGRDPDIDVLLSDLPKCEEE